MTWRAAFALSLAGVALSLYLVWAYTMGGPAICLAGSGCDTVQFSPYARVAGVPVPALGALYYAAAAILSLSRATLLFFGLTLAGVLFSAYLTALELFVIRAVCTWCVASALLAVALFALALVAVRKSDAAPRRD